MRRVEGNGEEVQNLRCIGGDTSRARAEKALVPAACLFAEGSEVVLRQGAAVVLAIMLTV